MTHILLTGAGFSRNWGAWLADEVIEYLLGCGELDGPTASLLWKTKDEGRGFEGALSDSQGQSRESLETAIIGMFNYMNASLSRRQFEFANIRQFSIAGFLARFDAIFTLNQDLLVEYHYLSAAPELHAPQKWDGAAIPGVRPITSQSVEGSRWTDYCEPMPAMDLRRTPRIQPYVKLHGSSNWREGDGKRLLIVGGGKPDAIARSPLLNAYRMMFRDYLSRPDARLMVIGYGFGDAHINQMLFEAVNVHGLPVFIVDRLGADVLDKRDPMALVGRRPTELMEVIRPALIGASRRPLSEIFGGDAVEFGKLDRFFER